MPTNTRGVSMAHLSHLSAAKYTITSSLLPGCCDAISFFCSSRQTTSLSSCTSEHHAQNVAFQQSSPLFPRMLYRYLTSLLCAVVMKQNNGKAPIPSMHSPKQPAQYPFVLGKCRLSGSCRRRCVRPVSTQGQNNDSMPAPHQLCTTKIIHDTDTNCWA